MGEAPKKKKRRVREESATAVDEEIAKLEAELAELDDDDDGLILSSMRDERIAPLPSSQLPAPQCRKPKPERGTEKRQRDVDPALLARARELVARAPTSEKAKIPFACRLCAFRGADLDEFEAHRRSPLHGLASRLYKEASYCKLCRVQTTSPLELKTHLVSKKHTERLAQLRD
mmetsp:Transcript_5219/g.15859  ORF Transcript_5219/g.15859 Transcript_5219/m.15859 type:complete len:174 (-) Transcript_5219:450-971(-)